MADLINKLATSGNDLAQLLYTLEEKERLLNESFNSVSCLSGEVQRLKEKMVLDAQNFEARLAKEKKDAELFYMYRAQESIATTVNDDYSRLEQKFPDQQFHFKRLPKPVKPVINWSDFGVFTSDTA